MSTGFKTASVFTSRRSQMHERTRAILIVLLLVAGAVESAHAQAGRADLRYAAPLPSVVLVTTVDSIESTMSGLPTGALTSRGALQSTSELRFAARGGEVTVTATLKAMSGAMSSPMGSMPMNAGEGTPIEMTIDESGPGPESLGTGPGMAGMGASPVETVGSARAVAGLIGLPVRELSLGETWTDTLRYSPEVEGMIMDITTVTHGTYESDSVVDGRTLNVLRITGEMSSKSTGNVQGMDVTQDMRATTEELVLWDSALHTVVFRDGVSQTSVDMFMPLNAMTMKMTGRTRSITTAQPQG
jgi:hypothetical protein